ncbi:MAG: GNAT family N-acetyltransferase [Burkholderiaceae bacterium]|nr:GNAT family N-acetyltransferase [Burkholderiaceae bacterium]
MTRVRSYGAADAERWDSLCERAHGATFLHTRRFLSYHDDRFVDRSLVFEDDGGQWRGVMPVAQDRDDPAHWISHPGITYGGVLHDGALRGAAMLQALQSACAWAREHGARRLGFKVVPHIYHRAPAQDDLYALFRLGAQRVRCDLASCIDLSERLAVSERRRRGLKKAQRAGLELLAGCEHLASLWPVLEQNLEQAHGRRPVHRLEEMQKLAERFVHPIQCRVALHEKRVVAGLVLFVTPRVTHGQYIASSEEGQALGALDLLFHHAIAEAQAMQQRFFSFGISTEDGGLVLNEGLHEFKSGFGAGAVVHECYEVML